MKLSLPMPEIVPPTRAERAQCPQTSFAPRARGFYSRARGVHKRRPQCQTAVHPSAPCIIIVFTSLLGRHSMVESNVSVLYHIGHVMLHCCPVVVQNDP